VRCSSSRAISSPICCRWRSTRAFEPDVPPTTSIWSRLVRHRSARWALVVIAMLIVSAIVGPMLVSYTGSEQLDIVRLQNRPPSWAHPFGTDEYSRDLLTRVLLGARISLLIA